jgi:hypothetical protein
MRYNNIYTSAIHGSLGYILEKYWTERWRELEELMLREDKGRIVEAWEGVVDLI